MNSHVTRRNLGKVFGPHLRQRAPAMPDRATALLSRSTAEGPLAFSPSAFSIARIYATFQLKRAEFFPEGLGDAAFDMLIDLFQYEWLNRRAAGPQGEPGMRLSADDGLQGSAGELVAAGLATITQDQAPSIALSGTGRTRLNFFFDYMSGYISRV